MASYSRWTRFRAWCWNTWGLILLGEAYGMDTRGYYACKARARALCPTLYPSGLPCSGDDGEDG